MKTNNFKQIRFFALIAMSFFTITIASASSKTSTLKVETTENEATTIDSSIVETIKNDYRNLLKLPEVIIENDSQDFQGIEVTENPVYVWSDALEALLNRMQNDFSENEFYSYRK